MCSGTGKLEMFVCAEFSLLSPVRAGEGRVLCSHQLTYRSQRQPSIGFSLSDENIQNVW